MSADKICCVPGCTKSREDDFVLHKFPNPTKDQTRFCTWVQAVGGNLLCLDDMYVFKYRRICHTHFESKYWTRSKMLSNIAIPTLHMKGSQCSEKLKNLSSVLVQHVKSHASESSAKTRKPFYLAETMHTANEHNEEDEEGVKSVPSFSHMPYPVLSVTSLHSPSSPTSSPPSTPPPPSGHPDVKKLKRRSNIEVNNEVYLNSRKAKIEKTANDSMEDPKRMFLLSLLPDVNAMSDNQMRTFKRRVISLIEEILEEKSHPPTWMQLSSRIH